MWTIYAILTQDEFQACSADSEEIWEECEFNPEEIEILDELNKTEMLTKKQLELKLQELQGYLNPKPHLEQYPTPADIASQLLWWINLRGELGDRIFDLGCGVGTLAIGAKLLNPQADVYGFDLDMDALRIAYRNSSRLGIQIHWICMDISDLDSEADLVIMNPPFGAQYSQRGLDMVFLRKAISISKLVYTIHRSGNYDFIAESIHPARITHRYPIKIPIRSSFDFHRKPLKLIPAEIYRIEC